MGRAPGQLTAKQEAFVAAYLGSARMNATKAAKEAGYSENTANEQGARLLANASVQARIQEWREEIKRSAIADASYRVGVLNDLEAKLHGVMASRAETYADSDVIGGETGLVVRRYKMVGSGEGAQLVEEYEVDTATIKELRAVHEQAAKELGQWLDKQHVTGDIGIRRYIGVDPDDV